MEKEMIITRELINKLVERARQSAENAYCPYTNVPVGCSILLDNNVVIVGCNIENAVLSSCADAGEVAIFKAVSEGFTKFRAICFWSHSRKPYPSGKVRQLLSEFNRNLSIVVATDKDSSVEPDFDVFSLSQIFPVPPLPEVSLDEQ